MRKTSRVKNGIASFFKYFFMIFLIFISLAPIIWAFLGSFKSYAEINSSALSLPSSFNLDNYKAALQYAPILKYFMNSVLIVGISVLVTVALVAMCAYVISRFDFKLKTLIVLLISASFNASGTGKFPSSVVTEERLISRQVNLFYQLCVQEYPFGPPFS